MLYFLLQEQTLFRAVLSIIISFLIVVFSMPAFIKLLKKIQKKGQPIREDGLGTHLSKSGTPTMGGIIIIFAMLLTGLLVIDLSNHYIQISWFVLLSFAMLGFYDDYLKVTKQTSNGLRGKLKFLTQIIVSIITIWLISCKDDIGIITYIQTPYFKEFLIDLNWIYFVFAVIVISGSSNAVNLTDGLDGLVSVPIIFSSIGLIIVAYIVSQPDKAIIHSLFYVQNSQELIVLLGALIGSLLGFLWFNSSPASIFMGDVGSLSIGAMLGAISIILKNEILFAIIGGLFVVETLSVIIQVYYFKISKGSRIFKMAPLHHHYEKLGLAETKVVTRFWIVSFLFLIVGLLTFC
jgi:phospho-N-acetylmuramoyl-pentapeptide-transferase